MPTVVRTGLPGPAEVAGPLGALPEVAQDADPMAVRGAVPASEAGPDAGSEAGSEAGSDDASAPVPRAVAARQPDPPRQPAVRERSRVKPAVPRHRPERPRRAAPKDRKSVV